VTDNNKDMKMILFWIYYGHEKLYDASLSFQSTCFFP